MNIIEKIDKLLIGESIKDMILNPIISIGDFLASIEHKANQKLINKHATMTWDKKKMRQLKKMENQFKKNLKKELGKDWKTIANKSILKDLSPSSQKLHKEIWRLYDEVGINR